MAPLGWRIWKKPGPSMAASSSTPVFFMSPCVKIFSVETCFTPCPAWMPTGTVVFWDDCVPADFSIW